MGSGTDSIAYKRLRFGITSAPRKKYVCHCLLQVTPAPAAPREGRVVVAGAVKLHLPLSGWIRERSSEVAGFLIPSQAEAEITTHQSRYSIVISSISVPAQVHYPYIVELNDDLRVFVDCGHSGGRPLRLRSSLSVH
jgi:hypothetical protein